jgi:hypothetical protein
MPQALLRVPATEELAAGPATTVVPYVIGQSEKPEIQAEERERTCSAQRGNLMRISKFATQLRLCQLSCTYRQLPEPPEEMLARAGQRLSVGKAPPAVGVDADGGLLRTEASAVET